MSGSNSDRFKSAITSIVERIVGTRILDCTAFPARVVVQRDDGTLDVDPDDPRLPGMTSLPIRGLPGVTVRVRPDARVLVTFENGDPRLPIATLFALDGLEELRIEAKVAVKLSAPSVVLADGGAGVARIGDAVQVLTTTGPAYGTIVSGRTAVTA